jgi:hypothetical protein
MRLVLVLGLDKDSTEESFHSVDKIKEKEGNQRIITLIRILSQTWKSVSDSAAFWLVSVSDGGGVNF